VSSAEWLKARLELRALVERTWCFTDAVATALTTLGAPRHAEKPRSGDILEHWPSWVCCPLLLTVTKGAESLLVDGDPDAAYEVRCAKCFSLLYWTSRDDYFSVPYGTLIDEPTLKPTSGASETSA
jgi:hypothetical protein